MADEESGFEEHLLETVALEAGAINWAYQCMCFGAYSPGLAEPQFVEVVPVCYIGTKLLVAVPFGSWHRSVSKRLLPSKFLAKAVTVEVGLCAPYQRETPEEGDVVKLWMGFVSESLVPELQPITEEVEIGLAFADGEFASFLPCAEGMIQAAQEHFAFETATEGALEEQPEVGGADSATQLSAQRLTRIEELLEKLSLRVDSMSKPQGSSGTDGRTARPSALRRTSTVPKQTLAEKFPMLDASVVTSAISAGVDEKALEEMQRLMMAGKKKQERLSDPGHVPPGMRVKLPTKDVLSESGSDAEPVQEDSGARPSGGGHSPIETAVTKLTELVTVLAGDKAKKGKNTVESALDGISGGGLTESGALGSGKRAAAARRTLRSALQDHPSEIHQLIERAMLEDLTSQTLTPGQPSPQLCSRAWVEHRSKIGHWKTAAHTAWSAAGALDALVRGDVSGCRARLCLLLLMLDQTACDRGSWALSSELSLEAGPPMAVLSQHSPPAVSEGELPFSKLLDPRWAEIAMSHLRETEDFVSKRQKLGKKDAGDNAGEQKPKSKAKAKAADKSGHAQADN